MSRVGKGDEGMVAKGKTVRAEIIVNQGRRVRFMFLGTVLATMTQQNGAVAVKL